MTTRYSRNMSQVLPHLSRSQKRRLRKIAFLPLADRNGRKTYEALLWEIPPTRAKTMTQSVNKVSRTMSPKVNS